MGLMGLWEPWEGCVLYEQLTQAQVPFLGTSAIHGLQPLLHKSKMLNGVSIEEHHCAKPHEWI